MRKFSEGNWLTGSLVGPETIQGKVVDWAQDLNKNPGEAKALGTEMVTGMGAGGTSTGLSGSIGKAIASEMPNSPKLDTIPKIFMGFRQGGFGGGMAQIGNAISGGLGGLFGSQKQGSIGDNLSPSVANQIGKAFEGSPAAQSAANTVAPTVNKTFDHLIQNSMFGGGLKMLADPSGYMKSKAEEFGISSPTGASTGGSPGATT